ncbi:MAG: SUMF1/EgtB/PvdO family nonheme iron enzyme [Prevotellaceae bacterium]|jgi:formylglycine-generating enzyme required for sulfatase activity|nr:SUMF1/EgtB/PvdO family nonheme iron enzyme [Prevotellaceae bacterium]
MRKHLIFASLMAILLAASGCSKPKGYLVGVYSKAKPETAPYGMVFVPRGSFNMGQNDQAATWAMQPKPRRVSVDAFWIDQTEITNGEYRQFVHWVRDSVLRRKLALMDDETEAGKFFQEVVHYPVEETEPDTVLNWKTKIPWKAKYSEDDDIATDKFNAVQQMYYYGKDKLDDGQANARQLVYKYRYVDLDEAKKQGNEFNPYINGYNPGAMVRVDSAWQTEDGIIHDTVIVKPLKFRSDFISTRIINIYPDTMVWMREFSYSFNEPMMHNYFAHPGFGEFPVVGVSWDQAVAFCHWRTELYKNAGLPKVQDYRLPTEAEWEYAARGGRHNAIYPWGGPYVRDYRGCFLANFKPMRGNYTEDGYLYPCKAATYNPNDYGLFDMAGNVAEWTSDTFDQEMNSFTLDFNPAYSYHSKSNDRAIMKRKVIKGGSWKDVGAYLQCGTRDYEYQTRRRASIGFRCVRAYIGN